MTATTTVPIESLSEEKMTSSSSTKLDTVSLLEIPAELKHQIIENLPAVDRICLKMTCRTFNSLIPPLNLQELLELEMSPFVMEGWGMDKDRFTCCHCLRLLPRKAFADQVTRGKMGKFGLQRDKRFCVQCGLKYRYSPGSHISRQGEHFVVCGGCREYKRGAMEGNTKLKVCERCRAREIKRATEACIQNFTVPCIWRVGSRRGQEGPVDEDSAGSYFGSSPWSN